MNMENRFIRSVISKISREESPAHLPLRLESIWTRGLDVIRFQRNWQRDIGRITGNLEVENKRVRAAMIVRLDRSPMTRFLFQNELKRVFN